MKLKEARYRDMDEKFEKDMKYESTAAGDYKAEAEQAGSASEAAEEQKNEKQSDRLVSEPDADGVRYYDASKIKRRGRHGGRGGGGYSGNGAGTGAAGDASGQNHSLRNALIILGIILVAVVLLGVGCNQLGSSVTKSITISESQEETETPNSPYIAVLNVEGTIQTGNSGSDYQHTWTLNKIDELADDSNNYGIILFVNSPGGGVYESDELYFKTKIGRAHV